MVYQYNEILLGNKKEWKHGDMCHIMMNFENIMPSKKKATQKGSNVLSLHLYAMSRVRKSIKETKNRLGVS